MLPGLNPGHPKFYYSVTGHTENFPDSILYKFNFDNFIFKMVCCQVTNLEFAPNKQIQSFCLVNIFMG